MAQNDSYAVGLHVLISAALVSGSHLCGAPLVRLRSTEIGICLGDFFRNCFRTQRLCLVRQWIQVCAGLRRLGTFTRILSEG